MRIIGIDPGTAIVGYAVLDFEKSKYDVITYGIIETSKDLLMEERIEIIYDKLSGLLDKYQPEFMAVEDLFYFKNNKTVISVAQARGIILLTAKQRNIKISSYTPLQVKIGITGYGKAEKKQVQQMVKMILKLEEIPKPDDAADALAIAITHINSLNSGMNFTKSLNLKNLKTLDKTSGKISLDEYKKLLKS